MSESLEQKLKDLAKLLDDKIDFKKIIGGGIIGTLAEAADGKVFSFAFKQAVQRVDPEYYDEIEAVLDAILKGSYEGAKNASISRLVEILKTPFGDEYEEIVVRNLVNTVCEILEKKRVEILSVGGGGPGGDPEPGGG